MTLDCGDERSESSVGSGSIVSESFGKFGLDFDVCRCFRYLPFSVSFDESIAVDEYIGLHTVPSDGYGRTKNGSRTVMNHCPPSGFFPPYTLNGYGTVTVTAVVRSCTVDGMQYLYIHYFVLINQ